MKEACGKREIKERFQCPDCPRSFATKAYLMEHIKNAHQGEMVSKTLRNAAGTRRSRDENATKTQLVYVLTLSPRRNVRIVMRRSRAHVPCEDIWASHTSKVKITLL
jgi:hypothetical protein